MVGMPKMRQAHYLTAFGLLAAGGLIMLMSVSAALLLFPAFVGLFILSLGYFPGEQIIERVRSFRRRPRTSRRPVAGTALVTFDFVRPVGRRITFALSVRPPPGTSTALS